MSTGASEAFNKQGIYDIAGNVGEWILEHYSDTSSYTTVSRGLSIAADHGCELYNYCIDNVGFRVSLF